MQHTIYDEIAFMDELVKLIGFEEADRIQSMNVGYKLSKDTESVFMKQFFGYLSEIVETSKLL